MLKVPDCTQQIGHPEVRKFWLLRTSSLIVLESHTPLETEYSWVLLSSGVSVIPVMQVTGIAIYYHPESHQAGGGESCSSELGMDILMPSLRAVPHFSSSRGSCKPTDEYPHSAPRGSSWGWDQ